MNDQRMVFTDIFEQQVKLNPDAVAVIYHDTRLTYRDLNRRADQFADYLLKMQLRDNQLIGVFMDRSPDLIVAILGILKSGNAYIPLDPVYPKDRVEFMLQDSHASALVTSSRFNNHFTSVPLIILEEIQEKLHNEQTHSSPAPIPATSLAYVLYTSGSTGKPKGVQIEHRNLTNFLLSMQAEPGISDKDILLALTTISFDIAGLELFLPLISGATILLADDETRIDGYRLLSMLKNHHVTILQATPATWRILLEAGWDEPLPVKALCGGEAFPQDLAQKLLHLCDEVWNMYGPTETTIWSTVKKIEQGDELITVGKPIANTQVYILDENRKPVSDGETGEIVIAGDGVARGYLNRPELTAEKFLTDPFSAEPNARMYYTGDLGRMLSDGDIHCLGRMDDQVKINGFRIELGEIEAVMNGFNGIRQACAHVWTDQLTEKVLTGYYIAKPGASVDNAELTDFLREKLPAYMVPSAFRQMERFPLTDNGKLNRKQLPAPLRDRSAYPVLYKKPSTTTEKHITSVWESVLHMERIGLDDHFFELGGNSLLATKAVSILRNKFGYDIPVIKLYQYPTPGGLTEAIRQPEENHFSFRKKERSAGKGVAVIGMAGRFPGADNVEELWERLLQGYEGIHFFSDIELDPDIPEEERSHPAYVKARGIINEAKSFDAQLFGLSPTVARLMDPQHRVFLEICREVLEATGHLSEQYKGSIGVFAGCGNNTYYTNNLLSNRQEIDKLGAFQVTTLNEKDYLSSRAAFQLNLKGPAVSVYSACSTSLLAVVQAIDAIRNGQCDAAIAGGISITTPINSGHLYQEGAMLSNDGHCRPFDAQGKGTLFSDGGGVVLLKDLEQAEKDGDRIYAVLAGVGVNNDGGGKSSFTAPSPEGQAGAIAMALDDAGFDPESITYVEAHGTATPIGDPIEIEGLKMAFGNTRQKQYCRIGSIKSNIGHLTHAAGVAGLIKTVLALYHQQIPPSIHYVSPNPTISFGDSPFLVNDQLSAWHNDTVRRAGVSSFGVGGTNVHVVLEAYTQPDLVMAEQSSAPELIKWSSLSATSNERYAEVLDNFTTTHPDTGLGAIATALHRTRERFPVRSYCVAADRSHLSESLKAKKYVTREIKEHTTDIAFMFPGQGSQYPTMGKELYNREKTFREAIDRCAEILFTWMHEDIRSVLFDERAGDQLRNTYYTQPAVFTIEYALAQLWFSKGIHPTAFVGHSIGEYVAAHLSGVFTLEDALMLLYHRAKLTAALPSGSMLSIRGNSDLLMADLLPGVSVAAVNAPDLWVAAGETDVITAYRDQLEKQQISARLLQTSHAFHSEMMRPILDPFRSIVQKVTLNVPQKAIVSTVTGSWLKDSEATSADYWTNHLQKTVRFSDAIRFLWAALRPVLLESGPGHVTATLAKQHGPEIAAKAIAGIEPGQEYERLLYACGDLWTLGIETTQGYQQDARQQALPELPAYCYDRKQYWIEPRELQTIEQTKSSAVTHPDHEPEVVVLPDRETSDTVDAIISVLQDSSGMDLHGADVYSSFIELGLDSLLLTQIAVKLSKAFRTEITFRKLNQEYYNLSLLAGYLDSLKPEAAHQSAAESKPEMTPQASELYYFKNPPVPHARLGKDQDGEPAWFLHNGDHYEIVRITN